MAGEASESWPGLSGHSDFGVGGSCCGWFGHRPRGGCPPAPGSGGGVRSTVSDPLSIDRSSQSRRSSWQHPWKGSHWITGCPGRPRVLPREPPHLIVGQPDGLVEECPGDRLVAGRGGQRALVTEVALQVVWQQPGNIKACNGGLLTWRESSPHQCQSSGRYGGLQRVCRWAPEVAKAS